MLLLSSNLVEIQKTLDEEGIVICLADWALAFPPTPGEFTSVRVVEVALDESYSLRGESRTLCSDGILFSRQDDGTQGKSRDLQRALNDMTRSRPLLNLP